MCALAPAITRTNLPNNERKRRPGMPACARPGHARPPRPLLKKPIAFLLCTHMAFRRGRPMPPHQIMIDLLALKHRRSSRIIDGNSARGIRASRSAARGKPCSTPTGKSAKRIEDGQRRSAAPERLSARLHHSDGMLHKNWRIAARAKTHAMKNVYGLSSPWPREPHLGYPSMQCRRSSMIRR